MRDPWYEFTPIQRLFIRHRLIHSKVWCAPPEFPIFWRVNNGQLTILDMKDCLENTTLIGTAIFYTHRTVFEVVCIYGDKIPTGSGECSPQLIPNTASYFKTLPEDIKEYYRTLYTQWTWDESKLLKTDPINRIEQD